MPSSRALEMRAGAAALPRPLRACPTTSRSMLHSGTWRAAWVSQSRGSRGVSRDRRWSKVRAAASRCVNASPSPHTSTQGGDQRGVAVLVVVHRPGFHPRGDQDRRDAVAGAVEGEPELPGGRRRVRGWDRSGCDVVIGAPGFVPPDEQWRVPDVGAGLGGGGPVGVEHALQECLTRQHRGRAVHGEVDALGERATECRVVVAVAADHVRLDQGEVRQGAGRGVLLELGEGYEVGGQPVPESWVVDDPGEGKRHRLHDVDLPGLAVGLESLEEGFRGRSRSTTWSTGCSRPGPRRWPRSRTNGS